MDLDAPSPELEDQPQNAFEELNSNRSPLVKLDRQQSMPTTVAPLGLNLHRMSTST